VQRTDGFKSAKSGLIDHMLPESSRQETHSEMVVWSHESAGT